MLPLGSTRLQLGEFGVGVFAIYRFAIDPADLVLVGFDIHLRHFVEGHAHHLVGAHGSVVPLNFIYGDVIRTGFAFRACGRRNGQSSKEHKGTKDCKLTLLFHGIAPARNGTLAEVYTRNGKNACLSSSSCKPYSHPTHEGIPSALRS